MKERKPETSPAARLLAESMTGQLSRREILKRGTALGLGAPLIGLTLSGQSRIAYAQDDATPPPDPSAGNTIVAPEGLRTDLQGQRVNAVLADSTDPNGPFLDAALARFSEITGAEATFIRGERAADARLQSYRQQWAAEAGDNDVYQVDVIWPGVVAEHAVDLSESLADLAALHFPAIVENNTVDGTLVGIPWFTDAGLLYYRTDLLEKYELEPPTTWDELATAAQTIVEGEAAANPTFTGFVWQGRAYEGLTCNGLEWQVSSGGGGIIDADGTVTVNNEQAIAAFDRARGWVNTISPEGVTTYQEGESFNVWSAGNAAFMRNWPYAFSASQDAPAVAGKVGVSVLPQGTGDGARNAATLGGWQLMVSRYSENQDAAIELVKFLCSPELQTAFAVERSMLPTIGSVYDSPELAEANAFIPRLREVFEGGAVARPSSVTGDLYPEISQIYSQTLNQILTGQLEPADGAAQMEEQMTTLLEEG